jgi:subtilisin family serine protease
MFDALVAAGVTPVVASGNDYLQTALPFPVCMSAALVVGSSVMADNQVAPYSNMWGLSNIILAPGGDETGGAYPFLTNLPFPVSTYRAGSGTSLSAPQVSGAIAVLRSNYPSATVAQIRAALMQGTNRRIPINPVNCPFDPGNCSAPRLDVQGANALLPYLLNVY